MLLWQSTRARRWPRVYITNIDTVSHRLHWNWYTSRLLFSKLWFGLTFLEVLANYPTYRYELIWSLRLCSLAESWYFKGMTIWVTSFPAISADASLFFGGARCERLKSLVSRLKYTQHLNNSTINTFVNSRCRTRLPLRVCVFVCHVTLDIFRLLCSVLSLVRTLLPTLKPNRSIS